MNVLLIGSGGREHALALALKQSESTRNIYAAPGNPGVLNLAQKAHCDVNDFLSVADFCKEYSIDLVIVGPEQPLADGIADYLRDANISVFGPSKFAAQLEASKGFAKDFMLRNNIPTAAYKRFSKNESKAAHDYIDSNKAPLVIKADGLAAGKGVIIADTKEDAHATLDEIFRGMFKDAGDMVVIENFLKGEEASVLAICDGRDFVTLASSQDHKRALDGDIGKNTGGMGAYAPAPVVTEDVMSKVTKKIIVPVIHGMENEGHSFIGCLYAGLMIENGEPSVVEFNVRFGDPETQVVLPLFEGDFARLLLSAANGKIDKSAIKNIFNGCACCVVMASGGYPGKYEKGFEITGIDDAENSGAIVYHAGTLTRNGKVLSSGGRVLGVTGLGEGLKQAIDNAYSHIEKINFGNKFYRKDIGARAL